MADETETVAVDLEAELKRAAQTALDVQDACNLSGVVGAFKRILFDVLWPYARAHNHGTNWVNSHPISKLFGDKITHLTGTQFNDTALYRAYDECAKIAKGEIAKVEEVV